MDIQTKELINQALKALEQHLARTENVALTDSFAIRDYCRLQLAAEPIEVFGAIWLDSRGGVIKFEKLVSGTVDYATVYIREVVKAALAQNASNVIFTHNHPSGHTKPSEADRTITLDLQKALNLIGVKIVDHIIVGHTSCASLAELGLI